MICPVCKTEHDLQDKGGLCWNCFKSLNRWALAKCKGYTKAQTGLALLVAWQIAEWLNQRQKEPDAT